MSKYKQIAEMTRIAYETEIFDESDAEIAIAEGLIDTLLNLYNAGYRKSQDVAREIFEDIDIVFRKYYDECSEKSELKLLEPLRQAERFIINELWHELAELKKKYIGEGR